MARRLSFELDVKKHVDDLKKDIDRWVIEVVQDIGELVIRTTPWKTGNLRNSWFPSIGTGSVEVSRSGGDSYARLAIVARSVRAGNTFRMLNAANYGLRVEAGFVGQDSLGRTYNQQGRFWVRSALARADSIAAAAAKRVFG